jgi:hypothetical protein
VHRSGIERGGEHRGFYYHSLMGICDSNVTGPCKPCWTSHDLPNTRGPLSRSWWERGYCCL